MPFRGLSNADAIWNEILSEDKKMFSLVYAELGNWSVEGAVRLTDAHKNINVTASESSGDAIGVFNAAGGLLTLTSIEEKLQLNTGKLSVAMDGINSPIISDLLSHPYLNNTVKVWIGFLDVNDALVANPILLMDGKVSGASIANDPDKGSSKIIVEVGSQWADFEKKGGGRTNSRDQQRYYPGDLGFEFAAASKKHIKWGR